MQILLQDYRDLHQQFDRIVSVGMFEHVGPKNYRTYFNVVERNLVPHGLFLLHTIGSNKTDMNVDPWINKYIFPNGCLPSVSHIAEASGGRLANGAQAIEKAQLRLANTRAARTSGYDCRRFTPCALLYLGKAS